MRDDDGRIVYRPSWADHVSGKYPPLVMDPDTRLPEPQKIEMHCSKCCDTTYAKCTTGAVRSKIDVFAMMHLHRDPMVNR